MKAPSGGGPLLIEQGMNSVGRYAPASVGGRTRLREEQKTHRNARHSRSRGKAPSVQVCVLPPRRRGEQLGKCAHGGSASIYAIGSHRETVACTQNGLL